jgi:hypothetical protein
VGIGLDCHIPVSPATECVLASRQGNIDRLRQINAPGLPFENAEPPTDDVYPSRCPKYPLNGSERRTGHHHIHILRRAAECRVTNRTADEGNACRW